MRRTLNLIECESPFRNHLRKWARHKKLFMLMPYIIVCYDAWLHVLIWKSISSKLVISNLLMSYLKCISRSFRLCFWVDFRRLRCWRRRWPHRTCYEVSRLIYQIMLAEIRRKRQNKKIRFRTAVHIEEIWQREKEKFCERNSLQHWISNELIWNLDTIPVWYRYR